MSNKLVFVAAVGIAGAAYTINQKLDDISDRLDRLENPNTVFFAKNDPVKIAAKRVSKALTLAALKRVIRKDK